MKRRLAKTLYWLSAKISFKVSRKTYRVVSLYPEFVTEPAGRTKVPNPLSMKLMKWSMRLDWDHWDHWACVHENCDPVFCAICGSLRCREEPDVSTDS